jgi:hypothetical protein
MKINASHISGGIGAFSLMVILGNFASIMSKPVRPRPTHQPSYASGKQILLVYIGSEGCKASLKPTFVPLISAIREAVSRQAHDDHEPFSTLGVSAGNSVELGLAYLKRFGSFDEISIGNGWLNDEAMHFVWQGLPGQALVPQVIVVERELKALEPGYEFSNERVLVRALGVQQIETWLADGAPIR